MGKPKFYAVAAGRQTGIFSSWSETEAQVKGFSGARYKGFETEDEAKAFLQQNSSSTTNTKSKSPSTSPPNTEKPSKKIKITHTLPSSFAIPDNFLTNEQLINLHAIQIYTDGSCIKNPGPGGWACEDYEKLLELSGGNPETTNNQMELLAAIQALEGVYTVLNSVVDESTKNSTAIKVTCDSQYVKNGIEQWMEQWKENNWKTASKKEVSNQELWQRLDQIVSNLKTANHTVMWSWVKGHSGHHYNERVDTLARAQAEQYITSSVSNEN